MRTVDGREFEGANVENAAYPLTVCAEKSAMAAAATAGVRPGEIAAVGISASPCGGCRQWLTEWRVPEVSLPARGRLDRHDVGGGAAARHVESSGMKSGFVAVAGRPNVGKSTLVNALAGTKVAIVSDKPHTTRNRIRGVHTTADAQLVLVDLPGWQRPIDPLTERMQGTVDDAMSSDDVDAILLVVSARDRIGAGDKFVARKVFSLGLPS